MTAEEFEAAYARRSGITVARLRELGRIVVPCRCGEEDCEGWASVSRITDDEWDEVIGKLDYPLREDWERVKAYVEALRAYLIG